MGMHDHDRPSASLDIFGMHDHVVSQYGQYVASFLKIGDDEIRRFVEHALFEERRLWPDALLQLNPAYEKATTVEALAQSGVLHPGCGQIFRDQAGQSFHLYRHQEEAVRRGVAGKNFVVTSGTGSGKSLTYFLPIFDYVLRHRPEEAKVRAIVVYPMNALVNSQEKALKELAERYRAMTGQEMPVRFACYTGQEKPARKHELQQDPPHILLTNYVMLELMLVRQAERHFVDRAATGLHFLVMDELHTYRGRQGADVALLLRRLKERSGNAGLVTIGTSATMASAGSQVERRETVAEFATKLFGSAVEAGNVVEETLRRMIDAAQPPTDEALCEALAQPLPAAEWRAFSANPLSAWIEATFGLRAEADGHLRRARPKTLNEGAAELAQQTGMSVEQCAQRVQEMLLLGNEVKGPDGSRVFAFKLHQFFSQGSSVYATLQGAGERLLTLDGQFYAPGKEERLLYPLVFCRVCGQAYYAVRRPEGGQRLFPNSEEMAEFLDDESGTLVEAPEGYFVPDFEARWSGEASLLPEHFFDPKKQHKVKKEYEGHVPRRIAVKPNGELVEEGAAGALAGWYQPKPFMLCLNPECGEAYTRRDAKDFRKLARLSSEGRSTATTLLTLSAVASMRDTDLPEEAQKVLSFTDNRQDASLQAGHFNDFVQVALLRAALYQALDAHGELRFDTIAGHVVEALHLPLDEFARQKELESESRQAASTRMAFLELVEYRLYEDLQRGWRVVQPNLEQVGLMAIEYKDLAQLAAREDLWGGVALMGGLSPDARQGVLRTVLDEMRRQLAIDVACLLKGHAQEELQRRAIEYLNDTWAFDQEERLRYAGMFILPGGNRAPGDFSLGPRGVLGRWLKKELRHALGSDVTDTVFDGLIKGIMAGLASYGLVIEQSEGVGALRRTGYRVRPSGLIWRPGDGTPVTTPLRRYRARSDEAQVAAGQANVFFSEFYRNAVGVLQRMAGAAHTAQIAQELRQERERLFGAGQLSTLFCSPTMELGVDIRDLNAVHMRNVPPSPANYAQRSGRAGRAGQPALVMAYCSTGSGHDQYFFRRRGSMVAGEVVAPRLDLGNEDLIKAHVHAIWLARTGLDLAHQDGSILAILDAEQAGCPLLPDARDQIALNQAQRAACRDEARRVLAACGADLAQADWYVDGWLEAQIDGAAAGFDRAFDRWRELYRAALEQLDEATRLLRSSFTRRRSQAEDEARDPQAMQREAVRQLNLLTCQNVRSEESDFYAYRYLASEGFLPGYNFPALPVRAYISHGGDGEFISRPRFLALSEFGPDNVIYHEGAKYQVNRVWLPVQDAQERFKRAKVCQVCGYIHADDAVNDDICHNCGSLLNNQGLYVSLLEMPTVGTQRRDRITCDEEERLRRGYEVTIHFRYAATADGRARRRQAEAKGADDRTLLRLVYAPAANLWQINHRWKRSQEQGYRLEMGHGAWQAQAQPSSANQAWPSAPVDVRPQVRLFVRDTANALLIYPDHAPAHAGEGFLATLQYALARGIQELYQVEEGELATERIGEGEWRGILLWEGAEGGLGVLRRLLQEPDALAKVARSALATLHFDPDSGADLRPGDDPETGCARACYECLLSYYNQRDHVRLDRHLVRDFLRDLLATVTLAGAAERDYEGHYQQLRLLTDSRSELERLFLDHLYQTRRRLPDFAQRTIPDVATVPDFFYESDVCVYCDGSVHDEPQQRTLDQALRNELRARGFRVLVVRYDEDLEAKVQQFSDVFGPGQV